MSEKRKVTTDALETLGNIIEGGGRDAIHLAVEPVIAAEDLYPGQHVGLGANGATTNGVKKLGIVDPFILGMIPKGKMFWLVVYPRTITSLRHVWEHPDFTEPETKPINSETWLREFCDNNDCPSYETVVGAVKDSKGYFDDEDFFFQDQDAHGEIPPEFWGHMENVVGFKMNAKPAHFSCSC